MEMLNQQLVSWAFARVTSVTGFPGKLSDCVVKGPTSQILLQMSVVEVLLYEIQKYKEKALKTYQADTIRPSSDLER